jgi:hypothetical protein
MRNKPMFLMACVLVLLACIGEYDPYNDPDKAYAVIYGKPFASTTAQIFSTGICTVGVALYDLLDSFVVSTEGNRYLIDSTISTPRYQYYYFKVSYNDTGVRTISLASYRTNGTVVRSELSMMIVSPLRQDSIDELVDTTLRLYTPGVADSVWYHWLIGADTITGRMNQALYPAYRTLNDTGSLWVSVDQTGEKFRSPQVRFRIRVKDVKAPLIKVTGIEKSGDTLSTGDKTFFVEATITDPTVLKSVSLNGGDFMSIGSDTYGASIYNLDRDQLRKISITAVDSDDSTSTMFFFLRFDSTLVNTVKKTKLEIVNVFDSVKTTHYLIRGGIQEYQLPKVVIRAVKDEVPITKDTTITIKSSTAEWYLNVDLTPEAENRIFVIALDSLGKPLDTASAFIFQRSTLQDTRAPAIYVFMNGTRIQDGATAFTTANSEIVQADVLDQSSVKAVTINGVPMSSANGSSWFTVLSAITHNTVTKVIVQAQDDQLNAGGFSFRIMQNRKPALKTGSFLPDSLAAGTLNTIDLNIVDADGDPVTATLENQPDGMILENTDAKNTLLWTPGRSDLHRDTMVLVLHDGLQENRITWSYTVFRDPARAVVFQNIAPLFPQFIEADSLMSLLLATDKGTAPFRFVVSAKLLSIMDTLMDTVSNGPVKFNWQPNQRDIDKKWPFTLSVTDYWGTSDNLTIPAILVLPHNADPCSLRVQYSPYADTTKGILDMRVADSAVTVTIFVNDNDSKETDHRTITVDAPSTPLFGPESAWVKIVVQPKNGYEYFDTIVVTVVDQEGARDTVVIPILFPAIKLPLENPRLVFQLDAAFGVIRNTAGKISGWQTSNDLTFIPEGAAPTHLMEIINGRPSIHLNDTRFAATVENWVSKPFTVFCVVRIDSIAVSENYAIISPFLPSGFGLGIVGDSSEIGMFVRPANLHPGSGLKVVPKQWYIIGFSSTGIPDGTNGIAVQMWRNGKSGNALSFSSYLTGNSSFVIGSAQTTLPSYNWPGDVAEVLLFSSLLADIDRNAMERYLAYKYGIRLEK